MSQVGKQRCDSVQVLVTFNYEYLNLILYLVKLQKCRTVRVQKLCYQKQSPLSLMKIELKKQQRRLSNRQMQTSQELQIRLNWLQFCKMFPHSLVSQHLIQCRQIRCSSNLMQTILERYLSQNLPHLYVRTFSNYVNSVLNRLNHNKERKKNKEFKSQKDKHKTGEENAKTPDQQHLPLRKKGKKQRGKQSKKEGNYKHKCRPGLKRKRRKMN